VTESFGTRFLFTLFLSLLIALSSSTSATVTPPVNANLNSHFYHGVAYEYVWIGAAELLAFPSSVLFFCALHQPLLGCRVLHVTSVDEIFITALQNLLLVSHPVTT
jgi:hypothetical protein